jgi:2-methylisocitrate lyase-like PEP mutase family enzyme
MSRLQKEKAIQFRQFHEGPPTLVLPNAWDAASAYLFERVGFRAIATTSSGVAAALGYADGQISRAMMFEVIERMTRVVECLLTVDIEAGHENTVDVLTAVYNCAQIKLTVPRDGLLFRRWAICSPPFWQPERQEGFLLPLGRGQKCI